ncbi:DUF397 domain-containing protein [Streptomyces sp. PT12]|uniref:DUF397 domain-containing protein n=1 Tax=Streptomyces sp. PT12 TaxID=1510197 RepID=UPI000DE2DDB7|nr:DUF397 domain-containing protein [Streptomyces sp. PT12]RBM07321.1 DUF397 domain-containing protein [Streptomyces sp. PT12]
MTLNRIPNASALTSWRKSSYSGSENQDCIEVADGIPEFLPVRDSKAPQGPALVFSAGGWSGFLSALIDGEFDAT